MRVTRPADKNAIASRPEPGGEGRRAGRGLARSAGLLCSVVVTYKRWRGDARAHLGLLARGGHETLELGHDANGRLLDEQGKKRWRLEFDDGGRAVECVGPADLFPPRRVRRVRVRQAS